MALTQADATLVASTLLNMNLGHSGPTVQVALQSGFQNSVAILTAVNAPDTAVVDVAGLAAQLAPLLNSSSAAEIQAALGNVLAGAHLVVTPPAAG